MPIVWSVYPPPDNAMALMTSHGIAVACHDKPMSGHAPAHAQPTFPLRRERLFADATESPPTQCSGATRRAAFKRPTAEVLCSTSGSDIHASSSIAWDQTRRPVPAPCRRLFPAPTCLNRVARIGIGLTILACARRRGVGVSAAPAFAYFAPRTTSGWGR